MLEQRRKLNPLSKTGTVWINPTPRNFQKATSAYFETFHVQLFPSLASFLLGMTVSLLPTDSYCRVAVPLLTY